MQPFVKATMRLLSFEIYIGGLIRLRVTPPHNVSHYGLQ